MLGLLLIYFLGKKIYDLAEEYNKNLWGNTILGVVIYYAGTILGGMIIGIILLVVSDFNIDETNDMLLGLLGIPFGLGAWYGFLTYLRKKWEKEAEEFSNEIDEIGMR